ncbi:MAG TPA: phage tail tube protein [Planctomycetota bacterium]|nr:phage tail tube protein [Planctomycetota bacterium]
MAEGARIQIAHVKESAWGTPSGTTYTKDRVRGSAAGALARSTLRSGEWRSDRGVASGRGGLKRPTFGLPFELSYGSQDDFLESVCRSAWAAAGTPVTGLSTTVVAGATNTMAATGIGAGLVAGDWIKVAGFTGGYVANNGFFKVTVATANLITLGEAKDVAGASTLAACTSQTGISVTKMATLVSGTTEKSIAFEKGNLDVPAYRQFLGGVADRLSLAFAPDQLVTGQFDFVCKSMNGPQAGAFAAGYSGPTTTKPIGANDALAVLRMDGVPTAIVSALSLNLVNGARPVDSVFRADPYRIAVGQSNLSGEMSAHLVDTALWTKALAETRVSLGLVLMDPDGATGYAVDIPRIFIDVPQDQEAEEAITLRIPFQVEYDATTGLVNWKWNKLA